MSKKLNSEVVIEIMDHSYLNYGTIETMQQEISMLVNAVAYLSNKIKVQDQDEITNAIKYKAGLLKGIRT
jgi:hypothetical protein